MLNDFESSIDFSKAYIADDKLSELRKTAEKRGGKLLSTEYSNIDHNISGNVQRDTNGGQKVTMLKTLVSGVICVRETLE